MTLKDRILFLILAGGFLVMTVELRAMHVSVVKGAWQGWLPVAGCALSALACLIALVVQEKAKAFVAGIFAATAFIGLYGLFLHGSGYPEGYKGVTAISQKDLPKDPLEGPPVLAPAGLTGLAAIALVLTLVKSTGKKS